MNENMTIYERYRLGEERLAAGDPLAAARALAKHTDLSAREIAVEALRIAGEICIYSNQNIVVEEL